MKRLLLAAPILLAACAQGPGFRGPGLPPKANPSAVIAAELGFARLAQEKGQWSAFRATATNDAVMFVPQRINAQQWLKGRADPATSVRWQPTAVWSSCDGSYAVTRGNWQSANASGGFVTVWQRQGDPRRAERQSYKWVLDMSVTTEHIGTAADTIEAKVADCRLSAGSGLTAAAPNPTRDEAYGSSNDNTLQWYSAVEPSGKRSFVLQLWNGNRNELVVDVTSTDN